MQIVKSKNKVCMKEIKAVKRAKMVNKVRRKENMWDRKLRNYEIMIKTDKI